MKPAAAGPNRSETIKTVEFLGCVILACFGMWVFLGLGEVLIPEALANGINRSMGYTPTARFACQAVEVSITLGTMAVMSAVACLPAFLVGLLGYYLLVESANAR